MIANAERFSLVSVMYQRIDDYEAKFNSDPFLNTQAERDVFHYFI
jgi:hypothetical protein